MDKLSLDEVFDIMGYDDKMRKIYMQLLKERYSGDYILTDLSEGYVLKSSINCKKCP